jgi:hypothetical protein
MGSTTNNTKHFFNLGYLPNNANILREKQSLQSQFISNNCLQHMKINQQYKFSSFNTVYYPVKATLPDYNLENIPKHCDCLRYIESP